MTTDKGVLTGTAGERTTVNVNGTTYQVCWHWDAKLGALVPLVARRG